MKKGCKHVYNFEIIFVLWISLKNFHVKDWFLHSSSVMHRQFYPIYHIKVPKSSNRHCLYICSALCVFYNPKLRNYRLLNIQITSSFSGFVGMLRKTRWDVATELSRTFRYNYVCAVAGITDNSSLTTEVTDCNSRSRNDRVPGCAHGPARWVRNRWPR